MRPSRWQTAVVAVIAGLVGVQLVAVTVAALPPQVTSDDLRRPTSYLSPHFAQDWRLFAPHPIGADRSLLVQGAYRTAAGQVVTSDWFDVTSVELDVVRGDVLGGRAGYGSLKLVLGLDGWWTSLGLDARSRLEALGDPARPASRADRARALEAAGTPSGVGDRYLDYDESARRLASDVARWLEPGRTLVAVRYRVRAQAVTPWAQRDSGERPRATVRTTGWSEPAAATERTAEVAAFLERHR